MANWSSLIAEKKQPEEMPVSENINQASTVVNWSDLVAKKRQAMKRTQPDGEPETIEPAPGQPEEPTTEIPDESISAIEALKKGALNLPGSAKKQVTSIIDAIMQPGKTWEGLKTLSKDIYKNQMESALKDMGFKPEEIQFRKGSLLENIEETKALDAVVDDLEKSYGSYENLKKTVATDPAKVIMDLGTLAVPAAKGAQAAAVAAKLPGAGKVAGIAAKAAALTDPITAAAAVGKQAIATTSKLTGQAFRSLTPTGLYKSAAKMSTVLSEAERNRLVQFALDNDITPTLKGLDKIDNSIFSIDTKISKMIEQADLTGKAMPIKELFKDFKNLRSERMLSSKPLEGVRSINRIKKNIIEANAKINKNSFTPKEVQKLKQTIYKDLRGAYESMKSSPANVKAQKAVAKSAKEYLESLLPEIKQLNKTDGDLIKLRKALERPASRISNRDITGLGLPSKIGAGSVAGGMAGGPKFAAAGAASGLVLGILDDPVFKSKLAIVINKLQKKGVNINENRAVRNLLLERGLTTANEIERP